MKLVVVSGKVCWPSSTSASGYVTDGGFPFQMSALAQAFDATVICAPVAHGISSAGHMAIEGRNMTFAPLPQPRGLGPWRKLLMPLWFLRNGPALIVQVLRADAVHAPIPGDIATIGMLVSFFLRKPLFVRYCGNWCVERTVAERFWKWFLQKYAGGRIVVLATGGGAASPSNANPNIRWIFSTSLTRCELDACACSHEIRPGREIRLITAGRQETGKGTGVVIQAIPILLKTFSKVSLDVVGDGAALARFRALAADLGVADQVRFHGQVTHGRVIELLRQCDLFCFPTKSEGFPKVVLEALACGLPVITTPVSVLPALIGNGCGVLIDEPTPEALAHMIAGCVSDPDRYRRMSAKAFEVAGQYSLERWGDEIACSLRCAWGPLAAEG